MDPADPPSQGPRPVRLRLAALMGRPVAPGPDPRREAIDWFIALREEPDDPALRRRFETWRDAAPANREAFASIGRTATAVAVATEQLRPPRPSFRISSRGWMGLAAAACLLIAALPALRLHMAADYVSGAHPGPPVRLADGSTVQLGPRSALAVAYTRAGRDVRLLRGQAWFEVSPDAARPFRVEADDVRTTVLGTGFDVRMIGDETAVSVGHGRVRVRDRRNPPRDLAAGQWMRIDATGHVAAGVQPAILAGAWRQGEVVVRNRPISEVVDEIRPWYRGRIVVADQALAARRVSGFYTTEDPARALELMVAPHGGRVLRITPWLLIVGAA